MQDDNDTNVGILGRTCITGARSMSLHDFIILRRGFPILTLLPRHESLKLRVLLEHRLVSGMRAPPGGAAIAAPAAASALYLAGAMLRGRRSPREGRGVVGQG